MGISVQRLLVVFGLISVLASLALTAFEPELHSWPNENSHGLGTRLVAFVSAVAAGILSTFSLVQKNRNIWTSWRAVQVALMRYLNVPEFTLNNLIDVYQQAEQSLGNVIVSEPIKPGATPPELPKSTDAP
jgi:K+-transporting ATPase A subunit